MKNLAQIQFFSNVSFQEKILFTKHIATLVKSGIPIPEALSTLIAQTRSVAFKKILEEILQDVDNGQSLSKALGKHGAVFDEFYVSLIAVSEESGTLEENLEFLSNQLSKDFSLRKKIKTAMLYPEIVLTMMLVVGGAISFFVLPKLVDFFESFDVELPLATKILLFIARTVKDYGVFIILGAIAIFALFQLLIKVNKVRFFWHKFLVKAPVIGNLIAYGQLARFSRNLGTLIKSGVPITRSLKITADTLSNLKFKLDLIEVAGFLNKGKNIGETLENRRYSEYPPIVTKMISVGEKSGKLDEVLLYLGEFYDDEVDDLSQNLSTILEPILLVVIGIAVGFVALAIITPIYELTGSIGR